jgi:hypothetical protein
MTQEVCLAMPSRAKSGSMEWGGPRAVLAPLTQGFPVSRDYRGTANLAGARGCRACRFCAYQVIGREG